MANAKQIANWCHNFSHGSYKTKPHKYFNVLINKRTQNVSLLKKKKLKF